MIPLESTETVDWSPPSLSSVPGAPVFRFRYATVRDARRFRHAVMAEGLTYHSDSDLRAEVERGLKALWSDDVREAELSRVQTLWATVDAGMDVEPVEMEAYTKLESALRREWPAYAMKVADRAEYIREYPNVAVSMFLVGIVNATPPVIFPVAEGRVSEADVANVARELLRFETDAIASGAKLETGDAFMELRNQAFAMLRLDADTEKNSPSRSLFSFGLNGSTTETSKESLASADTSSPKTRSVKHPKT